jgi:hypothetical protein
MTCIYINLEIDASQQEQSLFEALIYDVNQMIAHRPGYKTEFKKLNTHKALIKIERTVLSDPEARNRIEYFKDHDYTLNEVITALKQTYGEDAA